MCNPKKKEKEWKIDHFIKRKTQQIHDILIFLMTAYYDE